ncbi:host-nuclease inhibitor Gam family protein [Gimesia aquarii]|uniref:Bacteriophage Mu Gam like protein n=1 Tax=Gimesia aquarii TaxID=2527964 RepID=A0A517VYG3_9PLAN|nr:host-nuclease inhibitor Gam family protein [Gimesia aquarii]QDT98047.1 Bacteriophage Mu Gam like protein [Gimesia aquarii]
MKSLNANDRPAAELLGADPVIQTEEDLNKALNELSFLNAFDQSVNATCTRYIEKLKQESEQRKYVLIDDQDPVTITSRRELLHERVNEYCKANRSSLMEGKKKTKSFPHGSVSFKDQPAKVEYRSGLKEADSLGLLDKLMQSTLVEQIVAWLNAICIFGKNKEARLLSEVVELKPKLSVSKIKKAFEEKRLTADHLKQLGLKYSKGKEQLTIKPAEYEPG